MTAARLIQLEGNLDDFTKHLEEMKESHRADFKAMEEARRVEFKEAERRSADNKEKILLENATQKLELDRVIRGLRAQMKTIEAAREEDKREYRAKLTEQEVKHSSEIRKLKTEIEELRELNRSLRKEVDRLSSLCNHLEEDIEKLRSFGQFGYQ